MDIVKKDKVKNNKMKTKKTIIIGVIFFALFALITGFSFAYFSTEKTVIGLGFKFGQIKVIYLDSEGNEVDSSSLTISTKMNNTAKVYNVGDKVVLSGFVGLDAGSFDSYLRLQVFADFKNDNGTTYTPQSNQTTFRFQEGFNAGLASESESLKNNGSNDKQWFTVANNNYIYLGNVSHPRTSSTNEDGNVVYNNANLYNYNGTSVTITQEMVADELNGKTIDLTFVYQALAQKLYPIEDIEEGYTGTNANNIANLNWSSFFEDDYGLKASTQVLTSATNTSAKTATITRKFNNISGYLDLPDYVIKPNSDGTANICGKVYSDLNPKIVYVATRQRLTPACTSSGESSVYKVTSIEYQAFYNLSKITGIYIPETITTFGGNALPDLSGLNRIDYKNLDPILKQVFQVLLVAM